MYTLLFALMGLASTSVHFDDFSDDREHFPNLKFALTVWMSSGLLATHTSIRARMVSQLIQMSSAEQLHALETLFYPGQALEDFSLEHLRPRT
eukprot:2327840-Rhodomonas_salina.2